METYSRTLVTHMYFPILIVNNIYIVIYNLRMRKPNEKPV